MQDLVAEYQQYQDATYVMQSAYTDTSTDCEPSVLRKRRKASTRRRYLLTRSKPRKIRYDIVFLIHDKGFQSCLVGGLPCFLRLLLLARLATSPSISRYHWPSLPLLSFYITFPDLFASTIASRQGLIVRVALVNLSFIKTSGLV